MRKTKKGEEASISSFLRILCVVRTVKPPHSSSDYSIQTYIRRDVQQFYICKGKPLHPVWQTCWQACIRISHTTPAIYTELQLFYLSCLGIHIHICFSLNLDVRTFKAKLFSYCVNILANTTRLWFWALLFATQITMSNLDRKTQLERAFKRLHYFYIKPQKADVFLRIPWLCILNGKANTTPHPFYY